MVHLIEMGFCANKAMTKDDIMQQALAIASAQAGVRSMSAKEISDYILEVARGLQASLEQGVMEEKPEPQKPAVDPQESIRESSIVCLECGRTFKALTIRHLRTHDLDAKSYKAKWNLKKNASLACKSLIRARRKKMNEMQLWTRRKSYQEPIIED